MNSRRQRFLEIPVNHINESHWTESFDVADVIARVELLSVTTEGELINGRASEETWYGKALHHRFRVLEYLKGNGGQEIVVILASGTEYDSDLHFSTAEEAEGLGLDLLELRSSEWDDREAIVFAQSDISWLPSTKMDDTYALGFYSVYTGTGWYGTFDSEIMRGWLPIAHVGDSRNITRDVLRSRGRRRSIILDGALLERSFIWVLP